MIMAVFKEQLFALDTLSKSQVRIFPDACDFGIKLHTIKDPVIQEVKDLLDFFPDDMKTRREYMIGNMKQVEVDVRVQFERGGKATEVKVSFNQLIDRGQLVMFISIQ
jgi:hypothetical protein